MSDLSIGIYRAQGAQPGGEPQRAYRGRKGTNAYAELSQGDEVEVTETYRRQNGAWWGHISSINGQTSDGFLALMSKGGVMKMDPVSGPKDVKDHEDASEEEHEGVGDGQGEQANATAFMLQQLRDAAVLQEEAARNAREELEKKEQEEVERSAREQAVRKEREETERKAKEEDERVREEAAKKERDLAHRKIREEAGNEARRHLAEQKSREDAKLEAKRKSDHMSSVEAEKQNREEQRLQQAEQRRAMIGSLKVPITGEDYDPPLFGENARACEREESPLVSPRYVEDMRGPSGHHTLGFLAVSGVVAGLLVPVFPGHRAKQALALGALCAFAATRDDVLGHVLRKAGRSGAEQSQHGHKTLRRASVQAQAGAGRASQRAQSRVQRLDARSLQRSFQFSVLFPLGEVVFAFREATSLSKFGLTLPGLD